jgi:hypothetical protein
MDPSKAAPTPTSTPTYFYWLGSLLALLPVYYFFCRGRQRGNMGNALTNPTNTTEMDPGTSRLFDFSISALPSETRFDYIMY